MTEVTLADIEDAARVSRRRAVPPVVGNIDVDPDKAQRAMDLSAASGVPSSVIFNDLDTFEQRHKADMASALVANNPHLADFVDSDPMIPKLANDSYGSLDALSQKLDDYGLVGNFRFNWAERKPMPEFMQDLGVWALHAPGAAEHPEWAKFIGSVGAPFEAAFRAVPAAVTSVTEALLGKEAGEKTAEVMLDPGLQATLMGIGPPGAVMAGVLGAASKVPGVSYFKNGRQPPPGVVPEIDKLRAEHTADDVAKLKEMTQDTQSIPLWERNSDMVKKFILGKENTPISISADAVMRLYGDKLPEAEDGMLGWVPQIAEQLELARETGSYIKIPLSDWLTKIDPKVAQELYDDVIPREGGISKNEAKAAAEVEAAGPRAEPLPGEVPQVRAASALEPMFSVGDRKLSLQRILPKVEPLALPHPDLFPEEYARNLAAYQAQSKFGPEQGFHDFSIMDEKGTPVGTVNLSEQQGGKRLFIEMIQGINGLGPRDFGHALMFSLKAQLRQEFPNAELLGGHRVTGMREKMGTFDKPSAEVWVKLDNPDVQGFRQVLEGGRWESFTPNLRAYIKPIAERSLDDRHLIDIVSDELARIVPQKVYAQPADRIVAESSMGQGARRIEPRGSYIRYHDMYPIILYSLEGSDPLGTARHEAIHHLRNYGFFTPQEWSILEAASQEHGWIDRFGIERRYPKGDRTLKLEESIADAYKHWEAGAMAPTPELHGIFEKMKAFFERIRERIAQMLGKEPTWEDIFQRVSTGEIGGREGARPLEAGVYDERLAMQEAPKAANDADAKGLKRAPTYQAAVKKQQIERLVDENTERGDTEYWRKIAEQEGHLGLTNKPNMFAAARAHSQGGKTTLHIGVDGKHTVFQNGVKVVSETSKDLPERLDAPEERVKSAAIKIGDKTYEGSNHLVAMENAAKDLGIHVSGVGERVTDEGFITSGGRYIDRAEARSIAEKQGQIDQEIERGYGGKRADITAEEMRLKASEPMFSLPEEGGSRNAERAAALGVSKETFKKYDANVQAEQAADMAAAEKRAMAEQGRKQTKEWKDNRKALRQEVAADIKGRPDVAADLFFGAGELYGKKVPMKSVKLDATMLTPKQKAGLPREYYGAEGLAPDDVANMFGYNSGQKMVDHLIAFNQAKRTANMSTRDFLSRITDIETDRQMQMRYGNLEKNILDAVHEQVTSEVAQDRLHAQLNVMREQLGMAPEDELTRASVRQQLKDKFSTMTLGTVSSADYMRAAAKAGHQIESGLLDAKSHEAFGARLQQYYATVLAREAMKVEQERIDFDKLTKGYAKPFDPKSTRVSAEYSLYNRDILSKVGLPYGMSVQWLEKAKSEASAKDLAEFVTKVNALYAIEGVDLPVADFLMDKDFQKPLNELTVDQFRALRDSVTAMDKFGRDVEKVTVDGVKQDRKDWIKQAVTQLANRFAPRDYGATGKPGVAKTYAASLLNIETLMARWDGRDENGLFTRAFIYPGYAAADGKEVKLKDFSKDLAAEGDIKDANKKLESPLIDPRTGKQVTDFTRANLLAIIGNMGNEYNWRTFTKGWKIDPNVLWKWVEANSTAEDLDWMQALGKLFNKGKAESDIRYQHMYGVAPENIEVRPFVMHGKQYEGWYYPIIDDPLRSKRMVKGVPDPAESDRGSYWPSTANRYMRKRTGDVDVLSLSLDMVPIKLNQMLHDAAFREYVHNTAKIIRDPEFRDAVSIHYGPHYVGVLDTWLERIAGNASFRSDALAQATRLSNQIRGNVISTYIAFSLTTVEKHALSAAAMSARGVGVGKFARAFAEVAPGMFRDAVMDLFGRGEGLSKSISKQIEDSSDMIRARDRNFKETLGGQMDLTLGKSTLRSRVIELGSKWVAFSDLLSAKPMWWAKYQEVLAETGDAAEATYKADRVVRRAHGTTSVINQPLIVSHMNPLSPWLTSIYGFFGTMMQRRFEIAHDINDAYKLGRSGDIKAAAKMAPGIMADIMTYIVWPGLVEEAVTSQFYEDKTKGGLIGHSLNFLLGTAASTFIGIRDLAYAIKENKDPQAGLISSPMHDAAQLIRDVKKDRPLDKKNAGKLVEDAITVFGHATGMGPKKVGTMAHYGIDVLTHEQRPRTLGDIYRGAITGHQEKRVIR